MPDIQRYLNFITSQHKDKPKYIAWLSSILNKVDDASNAINSIVDAFDLDSAIGVQLDTIGDIIGCKRELSFIPTDGSSKILNDDLYRLILKAKIAKNQWNGTIEQIYELWNNIFKEYKVVLYDSQNMTMSAIIFGMGLLIHKDLVSNGYIVPKPQGVKMNYSFPENVFGYDLENETIKGYETGEWLTIL